VLSLQIQDANESAPDRPEIIGGQNTEAHIETHERDELDLLEMEDAGLQKRLVHTKLPSIAANGCRMGNDHEQSKLIVRRVIA
jgi:hypothetical protein